ncbi:MAG: transglycosylase domain-containing protein [Desulfopila sp.]
MLKKIFWSFSILILIAALSGAGALYWFIALHPGEIIQPENITSILGKESPVFYNDGTTQLGVFFDKAHRQYVPYEEIPVNFINALVASEDSRFFSHFGFDVIGITRAAIKNIQSGRIVQGGSTLTQQTAKNLFKRQNRSIKAKLKELLFALRLEYHYSKEKIFEFYANQFYVSGNGHGLGVAARYYFDKKPEELDLLQCAYIAGSVKRPNAYNPFIQKSQESRQKALQRGRTRVNYVLAKMLELGSIDEYQHDFAKLSNIGFNRGRFGYSLDYVMEMVKDAVTSEEVVRALEQHNINNISTSGVRIITTVDKIMQEQTLYSLRHDLSRLDVRLRGYEREQVQRELKELDYNGDMDIKKQSFVFGTILQVEKTASGPMITVDLGRRFGSGLIDKEGLQRLVKARVHWLKNPWSTVGEKDYDTFLEQLHQGDTVWVSVRGRREDRKTLLDLEKFPEIKGGALVIKDGTIKAMAGGVKNRFFNRAMYARRTMGSSFKPFVYSAALQLGWNSGDRLRNTREVFVFNNTPYFPRPDHHSPFDYVSMSWAGVKSENVASVWLSSHLCDKLSSQQFWEVASRVDMAPRLRDGERERQSRFRSRIRDKHGIVITNDVLRKAAFRRAVANVETDLIFAGRNGAHDFFRNMHYGLGFDAFAETINEQLQSEGGRSRREELELRLDILTNNYLDLERLHTVLKEYEHTLWYDGDFSFTTKSSSAGSNAFREEDTPGDGPEMYYDHFSRRYHFIGDPSLSGGMQRVNRRDLRNFLQSLEAVQRERFWKDVILDKKVAAGAFDLLRMQFEREMKKLKALPPYSREVLQDVNDFRIRVGLQYVIALAREMGVQSDLEPVLSFPLGSNVVTLLETLRVYEALATGTVADTDGVDGENDMLLSVIDRIESAEGEILYEPKRRARRVLAPHTSLSVGHILENVIKHGTGRYADRNITLNDAGQQGNDIAKLELSIPLLGKTGTANRYTNASFFGFLPSLGETGDSLSMEDGYAVGVYVGFDDNKPMKKGATRIAGSAGALPIWSEIVRAVVHRQQYAARLDPVDLSFNGLRLQRRDLGQVNIAVDQDEGGVIPDKNIKAEVTDRYSPSILTFGKMNQQGEFVPERQFVPFWKVSSFAEKTTIQ